MHRVVVSRRLFPELIDSLRREFDVVANQDDRHWTAADVARVLADADAALITAGDRVDDALLARCPNLKVVANIAVGYNNIDLPACTQRGVLATNTPDVLNEATADHAWALMLAAARRVGESERWLRSGYWKRWTFEMFNGAEISGTTLGVLGMGRIGRAIARRATGFSMRVIYHNRTPLEPAQEGGARVGGGLVDVAEAPGDVLPLLGRGAVGRLERRVRVGARHIVLADPRQAVLAGAYHILRKLDKLCWGACL